MRDKKSGAFTSIDRANMQKVGAFSEQNWKNIIHFDTSSINQPSINNESTIINPSPINHQPSTLPRVTSSKTVLKLDFRREALRDAAQMTFRKWATKTTANLDATLWEQHQNIPNLLCVIFRCFYIFFSLNISYSCCCVYFYLGFKYSNSKNFLPLLYGKNMRRVT